MRNRKIDWFLIWVGIVFLQVSLLVFWVVRDALYPPQAHFAAKNKLAQTFLLTDYCFSTESRHTRHLSMPEWIAPFQDLPGFHDHFPSSTFLRPLIVKPTKETK